MLPLRFLLRALVLPLTVLALPLSAVEPGDTLAQVLAEKGEPAGRMQVGAAVVLNYPDATVTLRDGKVATIKAKPVAAPPAARAVPPAAAQAKPKRPTAAAVEAEWMTDYAAAVARAKEENRKLVLFFTGSDWCGWCKRLEREVLGTEAFATFAAQELVLVKLDFPRGFQLPPEVARQNERLARQHRVRGYPTLIVLDDEAKRVGKLGYQPGGPEPFIAALRQL